MSHVHGQQLSRCEAHSRSGARSLASKQQHASSLSSVLVLSGSGATRLTSLLGFRPSRQRDADPCVAASKPAKQCRGRNTATGAGRKSDVSAQPDARPQARPQARPLPKPTSTPLASYPFTLHQLVVFKALTTLQSLDAAAELLSCSKNNISLLLGNLEFELGRYVTSDSNGQRAVSEDPADAGKLKLVHLRKAKNGFELTPAGRLLERYSERIIALAGDLLVAMRDLQNVKTGQMSVAASQTTGVYLMPPLIERFKQKHTEVTVSLLVDNTARCCMAVSRGEVDVAVVGGQIPADLEHLLQVTTYQEDEVVVVVAAGHPLAAAETINVEQLYSLNFVSLQRSSTLQGIRNQLEAADICWTGLNVVMEVNSVEAIKMAVEVGLGAAFVSRSAISKELELGTISALRIEGVPLSRMLVCVTDPVRYCSAAVRAFIREMFGVTVETSALGCFLPNQGDGLQGDAVHARYPELRGRAPQIGELSTLNWGQSDSDSDDDGGAQVMRAKLPQLEKLPFTLQQALNFRMLARSNTVKQAGLALGISPGAVSRSVATIEQTFGGEGTLLQRSHGRVFVTEAGQLFLSCCEAILSVATEACKAIQDYSCANTGLVVLGASQTTGTYLMPRLISTFRQHRQDVALQLQVDQSRRICDGVASGELDVAIIGGEVPSELSSALKAVPYAEDQLVLIAPRGHPVLEAGALEREQLYGLTFVSLNEGSTVQASQAAMLRQHGIAWRRLKVDMEFNSVEAIKSAVQNGLGVAFVSVMAIEKELALGLLGRVPIAGVQLTRQLWLVTNPARTLSTAAQKFMEEIFNIDPNQKTVAAIGTCCRQPEPVLKRGWQPLPWEAATAGSSPADQRAEDLGAPILSRSNAVSAAFPLGRTRPQLQGAPLSQPASPWQSHAAASTDELPAGAPSRRHAAASPPTNAGATGTASAKQQQRQQQPRPPGEQQQQQQQQQQRQ